VEKEDLSQIFDRYLNNEASPDEVRQLLDYFRIEKDSEILRQLIHEAYADSPDPTEVTETSKSILAVKGRLLKQVAEHEYATIQPLYNRWWFRMAVAASVLISSFLIFWYHNDIYNRLNPVHLISLKTSRGERKIVELADGTKVWLSPASSLEYPDKFRKSTRDIKLTGEAFFDVVKDKKHPFIVHAGTLDTKVLGTTFNIRAYSEDKKITVVLLTGKVAITSTRHAQTNLIPNQIAEYNPATNKLQKTDYPQASQMLDRRNGFYHYEGTPVLAIIADLKRDYNINIETQGDLGNCTFYGDFKNGDDPLIFLRKVCIIINAQFKRNENGIKIIGRGC